jgi:hypothetical protein
MSSWISNIGKSCTFQTKAAEIPTEVLIFVLVFPLAGSNEKYISEFVVLFCVENGVKARDLTKTVEPDRFGWSGRRERVALGE